MGIWNWIRSLFIGRNNKQKELSKNQRIILLEENGYRVWDNQVINGIKCGANSVFSIKEVRVNSSTKGLLGIISKLEWEDNPLSPNYSTLIYKIDGEEYNMFFDIEFNKEKDIHITETIVEFIGCILEKYTLSGVDVKNLFLLKHQQKIIPQELSQD